MKKHKVSKALKVLVRVHEDDGRARSELSEIQASLGNATHQNIRKTLKYMFSKSVTPRYVVNPRNEEIIRVCIKSFWQNIDRNQPNAGGQGSWYIDYNVSQTHTCQLILHYIHDQWLCHHSIMYCRVYSVSIFCQVGVDGFTGTVVLSAFNFCAQIFGIYIISKVHTHTRVHLISWITHGAYNTSLSIIVWSKASAAPWLDGDGWSLGIGCHADPSHWPRGDVGTELGSVGSRICCHCLSDALCRREHQHHLASQ